MSGGMDPRQWVDDETHEKNLARDVARRRIENEAKKFGSNFDPVSHEQACARETARHDIPNVIRKTGEMLNAEHAAKQEAAEAVVAQMFDSVAWDHLRNAIKVRGYVLIPVETDKERTEATRRLEARVQQYTARINSGVSKMRSLAISARVLLEEYDPDNFSDDAVSALIDVIDAGLRKIGEDRV